MEQLFKGFIIQNSSTNHNSYSNILITNKNNLNNNSQKINKPTSAVNMNRNLNFDNAGINQQKQKNNNLSNKNKNKMQITYSLMRQPPKLQSKKIEKQYFRQPIKQNNNNNMPGTSNLNTNTQNNNKNSNQTDLDFQLILKSMNNSYMQHISQGKKLQLIDMILIFSNSQLINGEKPNRFSLQKQGKIQDIKHYFKTIQIDQKSIFGEEDNKFSCLNSNERRAKYLMLLTLDGKQLKFQSFKDRTKHFLVNFDVIDCHYINYQLLNEKQAEIKQIYLIYKNQIIRMKVGDRLLNIYFTQNSMPYHLKNLPEKQNQTKRLFIKKTSFQMSQLLKKSIQKSRGYQFKLRDLLLKDQLYYQKNYATQEQFTQYCQTGDILLFKDNHTFAKIQRVLTNSEYDHIAFVYRSQKYGICLIQSSSGMGVSLTVWTHLIRHNWFKGIQCISWRRLFIHDKPIDFQQKVTNFVNQNLHKKYGISMSKIFRFTSKIQTQQQQKNRTYFCSQLVAQLYKQLGLLDSKKSSTQYWPKHFSDKGYISMLNNSALEHERILIFNQNILKQNYRGYKGGS